MNRIALGLLLLMPAFPVAAQKDAAEKVQEGNVDNWIEYYKKQRPAARGDAVAEDKEKRKEKREEETLKKAPGESRH